jgi:heme-degrading monooxygenase HmoA
MIARLWRGRTRAADAEAYHRYLQQTGIRSTARTDGNRGVFVLRRVHGQEAEFLFVSLWDSFEAIERFSGPDRERAVYYPEDERFLLEMEPGVSHFEVIEETGVRPPVQS